MLYSDNELVITDTNYEETSAVHRDEDGVRKKGYKPRDWKKYPHGFYKGETRVTEAKAVDMPEIDASDFPSMIAQLEQEKSRLSDFRMSGRGPQGGMIPARDQNGRGYCWAHSGVSAMMMVRARDEMPYVDLSAYAVACIIKSYRDEGGWGAQGLEFLMDKGVPSSAFWPQQSVARANDKAETWENAKLHRFTEGWIDMSAAQYDRNLAFNKVVTSLLSRVPVIVDFNWWSHSVCAVDAVNGASQWKKTRDRRSGKLMTRQAFDEFWGMNNPVTGGISIRILNSWGDTWSDHGMGVLSGNKAVPDGATAPRVATWAAA